MPSSREAPGEVSISKHETVRMRVNPMLQRSSRLRSSLIFSSSKTETHMGGLGMKVANEEDENSDSLRTTSIVQQILEKRRSLTREPFEWRKKAEENEREKEKEEKQKEKEKKEAWLKEEAEPKKEPPKVTSASREVSKNPLAEVETTKDTPASADPPKPQSFNMNNPSNRLQYFMELAAKRNASKEAVIKEPPQKKPDLPDTPSSSTTAITSVPKVPSFFVTAPEPAPKKPQVAATPELKCKPQTSSLKISEPAASTTALRKDSSSESQRKEKEPGKILKPFPSPKIFKRDTLKPFKSSNPRHVSCDEEMLTTDATDAEKSELKKSRSKSSSSMSQTESKEGLHKNLGSNTSLNTLGGEGKADTKPLDFLKKQTQRLKGFLGPKDKKSSGGVTSASNGDEKTMRTVPESSEEPVIAAKNLSSTADAKATDYATSAANHKAASKTTGLSRYQSSSGSVLFSSNLRDDTKVILEQISANSQKNRLERGGGEEAGGEKDVDVAGEKRGLEREPTLKKNRFQRPQANPQERDSLLKRIESMRKDKKVYSRFEMGNNLG